MENKNLTFGVATGAFEIPEIPTFSSLEDTLVALRLGGSGSLIPIRNAAAFESLGCVAGTFVDGGSGRALKGLVSCMEGVA